jgi:uncharacterized protein (TIGR02246 family)
VFSVARPAMMLGVALAATSVQAQTATMTCPVATDAAVASQFDRFMAAWATGNPATVAALFGTNATLLATVSNAERTTPAAIEEYFVSFLANKPVGRIDTSTIVRDCNTATRTGNWTVNMLNANKERVDVPARYTFEYKWDGKDWKIQHLHSSVRPAPAN